MIREDFRLLGWGICNYFVNEINNPDVELPLIDNEEW